jgi:outer membrane protein
VLAERSLEAEEKKLNLGASRSFFVLELQGELADAQIRETRAVTDYHSAVVLYELEKGTILEAYGIESYD